MLNRKGNGGVVMLIITAILAIVLITYVVVPIVDDSRSAQSHSESLVRDAAPNAEEVTLDKANDNLDLESGSLTIDGLSTPGNYSIDYDTGVVNFTAGTGNNTYNASYNYYEAGYLEDSTHRGIIGLVILGSLLGIAFVILRGFGLI